MGIQRHDKLQNVLWGGFISEPHLWGRQLSDVISHKLRSSCMMSHKELPHHRALCDVNKASWVGRPLLPRTTEPLAPPSGTSDRCCPPSAHQQPAHLITHTSYVILPTDRQRAVWRKRRNCKGLNVPPNRVLLSDDRWVPRPMSVWKMLPGGETRPHGSGKERASGC